MATKRANDGRDATSMKSPKADSSSTSMEHELVTKISQILQLDDVEEKDRIIADVLSNGRQALIKYEKVLIPEVYSTEMNNINDFSATSVPHGTKPTELLEVLMDYVCETWDTICEDQSKIAEFFSDCARERENHFQAVLRHAAEYGTTYTGSSSVLTIMLQLLFDGIDDCCLRIDSVFTDLFEYVTKEGLQGCRHFTKYISDDDLKEQLENPESPLFLALGIYYSEKIPELLKQHKISDTKQGLYSLAICNVTKNGWLAGIESIKSKIPPVKYQPLLQTIQAMIISTPKDESSSVNPSTTTAKTTAPNMNSGNLW